jgi:septum formation protein
MERRIMELYLASASPRRQALLRQIGIEPHVRPSPVSEATRPGETPADHVLRLARAKGQRAAAQLAASEPPGVILAADTEVAIDGRTLGKPADDDAARAMLRALRGRTHEVLTGVFLQRSDDGVSHAAVASTRVRFGDFSDELLAAYVATGEARDKAGAYGLQGRGALLVEGLEGSWSNVVGLPLEQLPRWLRRIGVELSELTDW